MPIVIRRINPGGADSSLMILGLGAILFAVYFYLTANNTTILFSFGALGTILSLYGSSRPSAQPLLLIDSQGLHDPRLGIGKILWTDILDIQVETPGSRRVLVIKVKNPEKYLSRLTPSQRLVYKDRHQLGFTKFNIDVRMANYRILEIMALIDRFQGKAQSRPLFNLRSDQTLPFL